MFGIVELCSSACMSASGTLIFVSDNLSMVWFLSSLLFMTVVMIRPIGKEIRNTFEQCKILFYCSEASQLDELNGTCFKIGFTMVKTSSAYDTITLGAFEDCQQTCMDNESCTMAEYHQSGTILVFIILHDFKVFFTDQKCYLMGMYPMQIADNSVKEEAVQFFKNCGKKLLIY